MYRNARDSLVYKSSLTNVQGSFYLYNDYRGSRAPGLKVLYHHCAPSATHDAQERSPPPRCHPETRLDILPKLDEWAKDTKLPHIAWLYGGVGAGKSAIAQTMTEQWIREGEVVLTFFFSRNSERRRVGRHFIPTLAYQLAMAIHDVSGYIENIIRDDLALFNKAMSIQFQTLIVEPLRRLYLLRGADLPAIIFVVDGLNECENDAQNEFLGIIREFKSVIDFPCSLRFLITSRHPHRQIRRLLQQSFEEFALDRCKDTYKDIRKYLESELASIHCSYTHSHNASGSPIWPSSSAIDQLARNACGQFIYAFTVLRFIGSGYGSPSQLLSLVLNPNFATTKSSGGHKPFEILDQLYIDILLTCSNFQLLKLALGYVLASIRGLTLDQLSILCVCNSLEILRVLHPLQSVLSIPDQSRPTELVTIPHTSFSDFLEDHHRSGRFFVNRSLYRAKLGVFFWCNKIFACDSCPSDRNVPIGNYLPCAGLPHEVEPSAYYGIYFMIRAMLSWSEVRGIIASTGCARTWVAWVVLSLVSLPSALVGGRFGDLTALLFDISTTPSYSSDLRQFGRLLFASKTSSTYSSDKVRRIGRLMFASTTFRSMATAIRNTCIRPQLANALLFLRDVRIFVYMFVALFMATCWPIFLANVSGWLLGYLFRGRRGIISEVIMVILTPLGRAMSIHRLFNYIHNTMRYTTYGTLEPHRASVSGDRK